MRISKSYVYWACQFLGWGIYVAVLIFFGLRYASTPLTQNKVILLQFIIGFTAMMSSHTIRLVIRRYDWLDLEIRSLAPRLLVLIAVAAITAIAIIHILMIVMLDWQNTVRPIDWSEVPIYTINLCVLLCVWSVIYISYQSSERTKEAKLDQLAANASRKEAELVALKAQINPHFLFNSLNNIRALVLEDPTLARTMITNLSDLLRYSIEFNKQEKVTVAEEIEIVEQYLQLESIQYDSRLEYDIQIQADAKDSIIPPMIVQTIVENAIKHGISQYTQKGEISISIQIINSNLIIQVNNTGQIKEGTKSTGIGIKNALERIEILLDTKPSFELKQQESFVVATLTIPQQT
ncbi:histidine kinase [Reichenbachiella agarivorans]|uniref:Histidine kinase n=1 Tax=Reichenbachiella agarivorans TaxID=2979464 RepID=A0ABY6CTU5_9BACT|nr:histidine kinase [Reichenbachiella agarivorans]UXP33931.1 histidine kinase [Reichenbachiella agarivorans]